VKELVMSRGELQILTNSIQRGDRRYIHVSYPFYDLELFTLDIGRPELTKIVRPDAFDWARNSRKPLDRSVSADELPSYSDLRNCLLSSGFLDYKNEAEIARKLVDLRDEARDPNKRPRPVFVAVDTNILYNRFLSRHLPMRDGSGRSSVKAADFRYVLSEIVQMEVDSHITHKYDRDEIQALATVFAHPEILREFANASGRRTRVSKLAFNEMNHLLTELKALRIKGTPVRGKERNDIEIAQSYKHWARGGDYDVFLLTADEDMVNHAPCRSTLGSTRGRCPISFTTLRSRSARSPSTTRESCCSGSGEANRAPITRARGSRSGSSTSTRTPRPRGSSRSAGRSPRWARPDDRPLALTSVRASCVFW